MPIDENEKSQYSNLLNQNLMLDSLHKELDDLEKTNKLNPSLDTLLPNQEINSSLLKSNQQITTMNTQTGSDNLNQSVQQQSSLFSHLKQAINTTDIHNSNSPNNQIESVSTTTNHASVTKYDLPILHHIPVENIVKKYVPVYYPVPVEHKIDIPVKVPIQVEQKVLIPQAIPYAVKIPIPFPVRVEIPTYKEIEVKRDIPVKVPIYEHIPIYHHFNIKNNNNAAAAVDKVNPNDDYLQDISNGVDRIDNLLNKANLKDFNLQAVKKNCDEINKQLDDFLKSLN
jgi:hypothetical protein